MGALIIDLPYCFMRGLGTILMTCHIECDSENGPGLVEHDGVAYIVTNPPGKTHNNLHVKQNKNEQQGNSVQHREVFRK